MIVSTIIYNSYFWHEITENVQLEFFLCALEHFIFDLIRILLRPYIRGFR